MLWYLLYEMKKIEKVGNNILLWIKTILIFLPFIIGLGYAVYNNNVVLAYLVDMVLFAFIYAYFKRKDKKYSENTKSDYEKYKIKLDKFRKILEAYELNSGKQVKKLLELSNEQKTKWKLSGELSKPFSYVIVSVIAPTLILILKWLFDHSSLSNEVIQYSIIVIFSIIILIGFGFMVKPLIISIIDKESHNFGKLSDYLQDIYLLDYAREDR